ncbi:hypothetical protein MACH18_02640 [Phaeobacter italicus]|jgi:hypothetical protein|nr:hypothetical protein MACH18_02640 [Phaeobacter italicus]
MISAIPIATPPTLCYAAAILKTPDSFRGRYVCRDVRTRGPLGPYITGTYGGLKHSWTKDKNLRSGTLNGRQKAWHSSRINRLRRASVGWF